jgi:anaerobic ribonucleoside-triphosphate reductase
MSVHICETCGKDMPATCPICNKPVDVYSRIVGYLRPVKLWNDGKQQEFRERKEYIVNNGDHIG